MRDGSESEGLWQNGGMIAIRVRVPRDGGNKFSGTVEAGAARGRQLGFPTANIHPDPRRALPVDGVYVAVVMGRHAGFLTAASTLGKISERLRLPYSGRIGSTGWVIQSTHSAGFRAKRWNWVAMSRSSW